MKNDCNEIEDKESADAWALREEKRKYFIDLARDKQEDKSAEECPEIDPQGEETV